MNLDYCSLNEVQRLYRDGQITYVELRDYLRRWNAGPHFTQAVWADGAIRNFDPERSGCFYRHLKGEFGLRL